MVISLGKAQKIYSDFLGHVGALRGKFLSAHLINPTVKDEDFRLDVNSFLIMLHAAFEEFIETTVKFNLQAAKLHFKRSGLISPAVFSLLHFSARKFNCSDKGDKSFYLYVCDVIDDVYKSFEEIIDSNHGTSKRHLQNILPYAAIDMPDDPALISSISRLCNARGTWAHKFQVDRDTAHQIISPQRAGEIAEDVVTFSKIIFSNVVLSIENMIEHEREGYRRQLVKMNNLINKHAQLKGM